MCDELSHPPVLRVGHVHARCAPLMVLAVAFVRLTMENRVSFLERMHVPPCSRCRREGGSPAMVRLLLEATADGVASGAAMADGLVHFVSQHTIISLHSARRIIQNDVRT